MGVKRAAAALGVVALMGVAACSTSGQPTAGQAPGTAGSVAASTPGLPAGTGGDSAGPVSSSAAPVVPSTQFARAYTPHDNPNDLVLGCPDWANVTSDMLVLSGEHGLLVAFDRDGQQVAACDLVNVRYPTATRDKDLYSHYGQINPADPTQLAVHDLSGDVPDRWAVMDLLDSTVSGDGQPGVDAENGVFVSMAPVVEWVDGKPATGPIVLPDSATDGVAPLMSNKKGLPLLSCEINKGGDDDDAYIVFADAAPNYDTTFQLDGVITAVHPDGSAVGYSYLWAWYLPGMGNETQFLVVAQRVEGATDLPCQVKQVFTYEFPRPNGEGDYVAGGRTPPHPVLALESGDTRPPMLLMFDPNVQHFGDEPQHSQLFTMPLADSTGLSGHNLVVSDMGAVDQPTIVHWPGWQ